MRIKYINFTRALCMLWIVGFWHLGGVSDFNYSNKVTLLFTKGILTTFVYLSGHLLANNKINGLKDIWKFYWRRLKKIYPLFCVSTTCFYILHLYNTDFCYVSSMRQYIMSILGIACIFTPAPDTIWFVEMMFLFWGVTPIIIRKSNHTGKILFSLILYILFFLIVFAGGDDRLLLYFPAYTIGLLSTEHKIGKSNRWFLNMGIIIGFILLCTIYGKTAGKTGTYFIELMGGGMVTYIMIAIGKNIEKNSNRQFSVLLNWLSYTSMTAYLFHNHIYELISNIIGKFSIWEAYLLALPTVLIVSRIIQLVYDNVLASLN